MSDEEFQDFKTNHVLENFNKKTYSKLLPINFILVIITMFILIKGLVPGYYLFMILLLLYYL